ncbi:MAG: c-type cytochrome [Planctomycetota bacterium]|nr:c-type cytochrome [Planctomycetota bacterium]
MAKREPRSIKIHHMFFAAGCAGLMLTTVWAFYNDYFQREYPKHQQAFNQVEIEILEKARKQAWDEWHDLKSENLDLMDKQKKAQEEVRRADRALRMFRENVNHINDDLALTKRKLNFAGTDTGVYNWDWLAAKEGKDKAYEKVLEHAKYTRELFNTVEEKTAELNKNLEEIAKEENNLKNAKKALAAFDGRLLETLKALEKAKGNPALNFVKDAPGIDFIQPRWNLNDQIVLQNLPVDVLFAKTDRVDRCVVCHKGIDNPDPAFKSLDGDQKVLKAHPRLDLFVSANSKHPMKVFGCTICHQGRGMGVSFLRSAHTPQNHEQGEAWRAKYGWNTLDQHAPGQPLWDAPMLPLQYTEASCAKCHKGVDKVPEAAKLNKGREIFRERGCVNCHVGTTDPDLAWMGRIGPDLRHLGEKTDSSWTRRWIENPWEFRPDTKMPRIFGLENRKEAGGRALQVAEASYDQNHAMTLTGKEHPRDPAEVEAITTYLFATSKLRERKLPAPPKGDAAKGKQVFAQVGCLACHSTTAAKDKYAFNNHGPDLSRIGEKVHPAWLFDWLKNPKHYWAETRMPSLRLSDDEAANLTAYLLETMKSEHAAPAAEPEAPAWAYDALIRDLLANNTPDFQIARRLGDPDGLVRGELLKKVKFGIRPGEDKKSDLGTGEWTEPQIEAVVKILDEMGKDDEGKARVKKAFYTGSSLIQQYGCFACHNIQGWTNAPLSCVNLNGEGDKDVDKFAFGNAHIPHTRWDWIYLKIARPRVYDEGALEITKPNDRLRMPWFGYEKGAGGGGHGHGADAKPHAAAKAPSGLAARASGGGDVPAMHSALELAQANPDATQGHGLSHEDVESLVTVVLSYTNQPIPMEMMKKPTAREVAIDRGERAIHALNCTGCHLVGLEKPVVRVDATGKPDLSTRGQVPLAALLTREAQAEAKLMGMFSDRNEFSLTHDGAAGFLHFGKGTYLTEVTIPILLGELPVRRSPSEPAAKLGFRFLKETAVNKLKEGKDRWVPYGTLVNEEQFLKLTAFFFEGKTEVASNAYTKKYKDQYVNIDAYERIAGTAALKEASEESGFKLSDHDYRAKVADGSAWPAYQLDARWTHGEGKLVPHFVATEGSQQQAPPSLSYQGGKVQPDWFYRFLHDVQPLRPTLNIRMPSFWEAGHAAGYKSVYPAGRASAVDPDARPMGVDGEPAPGPDSLVKVPDDAEQIIEFFNALGDQKPYGYQPVPVMTEATRKKYLTGYHLLFPADPKTNPGGVSCTSCHSVGTLETPAPKGPNLIVVKRRFKDEWLLRFLTFPQAMYPWANMPANFYDWGSYEYTPDSPLRNMGKGDEKAFKELTDKINAVRFYMLSSGEAEIGTTPPPGSK